MYPELFELHLQYLKVFYEYFYQRYRGVGINVKPNLKYMFNPTATGLKYLDNFINEIAKDRISSYGPNFYFNYFAFQWYYWSNSEKIKIMTINPGSIFDKKAYERWRKRNKDFDYKSFDFCKKHNIIKSQVIGLVKKDDPAYKFNLGEYNRKLYENGSKERLANCLITTTLFSKTSSTCATCKSKTECKEIRSVINYKSVINE